MYFLICSVLAIFLCFCTNHNTGEVEEVSKAYMGMDIVCQRKRINKMSYQ
jgi:hypothetical protein